MKQRFRRVVWLALCLCTLAFIWSNSLRVPESSMRQSGVFADLLSPFLNPFGALSVETVSFLVRKLAHFTEFSFLGFCVAGLRSSLPRFRLWTAFLVPVACACADECLQLFSGRSCQFSDVCLDSAGGCFGIVLFLLILRLIRRLRRGKRHADPARGSDR